MLINQVNGVLHDASPMLMLKNFAMCSENIQMDMLDMLYLYFINQGLRYVSILFNCKQDKIMGRPKKNSLSI